MPSPNKNEDQDGFIQRCMSSEESKRSFPDSKHRVAFCHSQWKNKSKSNLHILEKASLIYADEKAGYPPNCNEGYYEKNGKCVPMDYTEGPTEAVKNPPDPKIASASEYKCPYDDLDTIWTGETKIILSRPFYVMRCPHGHETLSESPR